MTILQSLDGYYQRLFARNEVVPPGYSVEPVGVLIELAPDGSVLDVHERKDPGGKKAKPERVPKWFGRSGQGSTPYFLWDNSGYALGVTSKPGDKVARDHAAFRTLHLDALAEETDEGLAALRRFIEGWSPEQFAAPRFLPAHIDQNIGFALAGEHRMIHERPAAMALVERMRQPADAASIFCLVTGEHGPGVRLHPKVKGVDGTSIAEVPLVSFNEAAFESYGKEQGWNAPTSAAAAFRYTAALTRLLDRNGDNRIKIADATVAFWADASGNEPAAAASERNFKRMMAPPGDASEAAKLRDALEDARKGRPAESIEPKLKRGVRFHILGLAPNAARITVRYWLSDEFGVIEKRLARHFQDIAIEPPPWRASLPSIQRLLVNTTAVQGKFENIPPLLAGEMLRAMLEGRPYPRTLLATAIMRLRAGDDPAAGWHAAVIKACINRRGDRPSDLSLDKETLPVARNPDHPSSAYQLGRLFAVMEAAQYAALGKVNASIVDRYYGSASATPARVFGTLLRGARVHIADAGKRNKGLWLESRLGEIMSRLDPDLPRTLDIEDQGRFAVGYYHERWRAKKDEGETDDPAEDDTDTEPKGK